MIAIGAAVTILAVTAGTAIALQLRSSDQEVWPSAPVGGPFLTWPATGDALRRHDLVDAAIRVWDRHIDAYGVPAGTHHDVTVLLVQSQSPTGAVLILQGYDPQGKAKLAILSGTLGATAAATDLQMRADRDVPDPIHTHQISLVSSRTGSDSADGDPAAAVVALALASPTAIKVALSNPAGSSPVGTGTSRLSAALLPAFSTSFTTRVAVTAADGRTETMFADDRTIGEPYAVPITALPGSKSGHLRIDLNAAAARNVRAGHLVATRQGLVGRVVAPDGENTAVERIDHPGFSVPIVTAQGQRAIAVADPTGHLDATVADIPVHTTIFAAQTSGSGPETVRVRLPLGTATAPVTPPPATTGSAWTTTGISITPAENPNTTQALFLLTADVRP
jgi:hypothetical protein